MFNCNLLKRSDLKQLTSYISFVFVSSFSCCRSVSVVLCGAERGRRKRCDERRKIRRKRRRKGERRDHSLLGHKATAIFSTKKSDPLLP